MPQNETSTMLLESQTASTTNKYVNFTLQVLRPDSSPVVTGDVKFVSARNPVQFKFTQSIVRTTSGSWKVALKSDMPGTWNGELRFSDPSGTHADVSQRVSFNLLQGPTPSPKPSPTAETKPKPAKTDGCRNQIKN